VTTRVTSRRVAAKRSVIQFTSSKKLIRMDSASVALYLTQPGD